MVMSIIKSTLSTRSEKFKNNESEYRLLIEKLNDLQSIACYPESEKSLGRLKDKNQFPTQERIQRLIDPGSPILEIGSLAGLDQYDGVPPGAGVRAVIASVAGTVSMIIANNPSVKGGTYFPLSVKKHLRAQAIADDNFLPCIHLVDSGGAFLPLQSEVFPDRDHFGRIFFNQSNKSKKGIPQISAVLGSCTAGGAYVPAMSDEAIMVRGNSSIFLGGPPLVKAATGEEVTAEELGGADVHCNISGVADHLVEDEGQALSKLREIVATTKNSMPGRLQPSSSIEEPAYDPSEIYGLFGTDLRKSPPVLEIIARLVDGSRFEQFKAGFGETVKCGFARIRGFDVGIIANDGILFSESALKVAHFVQICDRRRTPILFLQNISGFMVGKEFEHGGIAKHGAKMVNAVSTCSVPKYTLIMGGSFGAGNYGMCGRAYDPRFLFAWPGSRISVMGGEQAANVLAEVSKKSAAEIKKMKAEVQDKYEKEGNAFHATSLLWDDGIIDPLYTRETLALALGCSPDCSKQQPESFGIFRM